MAFLAGNLISIMLIFNSALSEAIGVIFSVFIINIVGLILTLLGLFNNKNRVRYSERLNFLSYLGGILGILIVLSNNITVIKIGVVLSLSLGISAQIITSIFIDHWGALGSTKKKFSIRQLPGIIMVIMGSIIIVL